MLSPQDLPHDIKAEGDILSLNLKLALDLQRHNICASIAMVDIAQAGLSTALVNKAVIGCRKVGRVKYSY